MRLHTQVKYSWWVVKKKQPWSTMPGLLKFFVRNLTNKTGSSIGTNFTFFRRIWITGFYGLWILGCHCLILNRWFYHSDFWICHPCFVRTGLVLRMIWIRDQDIGPVFFWILAFSYQSINSTNIDANPLRCNRIVTAL